MGMLTSGREHVVEEIRDITWGLWGEELSHEQAIQRIVAAGFPLKGGVVLTMFAIVEGESGEYQRAWHVNVERNDDGTIRRYWWNGSMWITVPVDGSPTYMKVKSIDLGFMQFNVNVPDEMVEMDSEALDVWVNTKFDENPDLADPWKSAERAYTLWRSRGFSPWYAYKPGTPEFRLKKRYGALAIARWLVHSFVGKDPDGKLPRIAYVE